jgi:hypothetical protein
VAATAPEHLGLEATAAAHLRAVKQDSAAMTAGRPDTMGAVHSSSFEIRTAGVGASAVLVLEDVDEPPSPIRERDALGLRCRR